MAYTEFCCRSGGSNLNAGTRTGSSTEPGTSADLTYASGSWVAGSGVFTVASGDPVTDGVAVGDFASVYADGASVTGFVGRVTARTSTTITVSLSAKAGTAPTNGTNDRTLKIGGAWAGPSGSESFPFKSSFDFSLMTNSSSDKPRINLKNNQTYSVSANINPFCGSGYGIVQGYGTGYGDGVKATITGGTTGASFVVMTCVTLVQLIDLVFDGNGATGNADLSNFDDSGGRVIVVRCVFTNARGSGCKGGRQVIECEAYACNQSNTSGRAGFDGPNNSIYSNFTRCISHDNTGSNNRGFYVTNSGAVFDRCIADSNGEAGFFVTNAVSSRLTSCDAYNNGGSGVVFSGGNNVAVIENSNFIKNGAWGIALPAKSAAILMANRFGSGTQANTSGTVQNDDNAQIIDHANYAANVTPWTDPDNGDFRINLAAAKGAGRGAFLQTAAGYSGTVAYPDIGAAQSAGGGASRPMNPFTQQVIG
jgi:hypothetical protein